MKKLIVIVLFAIGITACNGTPTPSATLTPSGPVTRPTSPPPVPTKNLPANSGITLTNLQTAKQPSGDIRTTGTVATQDNLGLGQIELAYPETMQVGSSRNIILRIAPAQQLVGLTPVAVPVKTPNAPSIAFDYKGNLQLYPVMIAQMRALAFTFTPSDAQSRNIDGTKQIEWLWNVSATIPGRQDLFIEISIPVVRNGVASEISTDVLQNVPLTIQVSAAPIPTPTPAPIISRIGDSIINNSGAIIVALIGLAGTLIGIWLKARSDQAKAGTDAKK